MNRDVLSVPDKWEFPMTGQRGARDVRFLSRAFQKLMLNFPQTSKGITAGTEGTSQTPCGCPFQAWSLGELLRLDRIVLA